jgi:opacity protein-like surface antigen
VKIPGQAVQFCVHAQCSDTSTLKVPPQDVKVTVTGNTATVTLNVEVNGSTKTVTIPVEVKGQTQDVTLPVTVNGKTVDKTVHVEVTGKTDSQNITLNLPAEQKVQANVTRTIVSRTEVDELFDARAKFGVAMGQSWMLYATGGASIGHFTKRIGLTQTTSVPGDVTRTDTFTASSGDTRLGWVVGTGLDWKPGQNWVFGVLYRHHEFPKGTVSFADGSNSVGFGTSSTRVDSVQGRISYHLPIH